MSISKSLILMIFSLFIKSFIFSQSISKNSNETNLLNVINYTKTTIGKRYLNCQLTMPLIDSVVLNKRYNTIEKIITNNYQDKLINYLEDIYDMDKLIRKVEINIINSYELYQLYISLYQLLKLNNYCKKHNLFENKIKNFIFRVNNLII